MPRHVDADSMPPPVLRQALQAWFRRWPAVLSCLWLLALPQAAQPRCRLVDQAPGGGVQQGPPTQPAERLVRCPTTGRQLHPGSDGPVWYRVQVRVGPPAGPATCWPCSSSTPAAMIEVQLNGQAGAQRGACSLPYHNCDQPQLSPCPGPAAPGHPNLLDLRVVGEPLSHVGLAHPAGGAVGCSIGPQAELAPPRAATLLQVQPPAGAVARRCC
jgi:hypothetical protein